MLAQKVFVRRDYYKNMTQTFNPSASFQTFTVPAGTTKLEVDCVASRGGDYQQYLGASGGRVQCVLPVTTSTMLYIYVGAIPVTNNTAEYNASDIRTDNTGVLDNTSLSSRLVVAGGGGSTASGGASGAGGGLIGGDGSNNNYGGKGGTQTAGGAKGAGGSTYANDGTFGLGGSNTRNANQGAGGAGWYGGGSAGGTSGYGGGGGSSYTDISCFDVVHTQGYNDGSGYITIDYTVLSDSTDYDFYEDVYIYKGIKKIVGGVDTYYAVKDYKKGQHYGS